MPRPNECKIPRLDIELRMNTFKLSKFYSLILALRCSTFSLFLRPSSFSSSRPFNLVDTTYMFPKIRFSSEATATNCAFERLLSTVYSFMVYHTCFVKEPLSTDAALELGLLMNQLVPFDLAPRPISLPAEFAIVRCIVGMFQNLVVFESELILQFQEANITLVFHTLMHSLKRDKKYQEVSTTT